MTTSLTNTDKVDTAFPTEWLVANGLGGYASSTIADGITRRYHGLLIAALPVPFGRTIVLNDLGICVERGDGSLADLIADARMLKFSLTEGLPRWLYELDGALIEKSVLMPARRNIVHITLTVVEASGSVRLRLRPFINFRPLEAAVDDPIERNFVLIARGAGRYEVDAGVDLPNLKLAVHTGDTIFVSDGGSIQECVYPVEAERGYISRGSLWTPGYFSSDLGKDKSLTLIVGTDPWNEIEALAPEQALTFETERRHRLIHLAAEPTRTGTGAALVIAADAFLIAPVGRIADVARAGAQGDEIRTVIAGYHWFTDWGRDTMISLEGLTLTTGRALEARWILRTFAHYVRDGLIPNMFPDGRNEGLYHTADATLWFFHALHRYMQASDDRETLEMMLPILKDIINHHLAGTRFGIRVDPADGLLTQGADGYQLTWMDAKVGDWVVTPRRGKAVEINALWYNALKLLGDWLTKAGDPKANEMLAHASRAAASFNIRFWHAAGNFLYDVVDGPQGDDGAFRPNQILAISLEHPILESQHWQAVVLAVKDKLLTPVGLRSLAPGEPDYKAHYFGDVRARDAAYHQGTVWAWLIGPFIDAWLRTFPDKRAEARGFLEAFGPHLEQGGAGFISEIFDASPPFTPRGCIAQAWSVAEVLRALVKCAQ